MKEINKILTALDAYFEDKSENEKWMIIGMVVVVVGYLAYALFLPIAEEKYNASNEEKNKLQQSVDEYQNYMQSITINGDKEYYVKKYDQDIKDGDKAIADTNNNIYAIDASLEELSPMLFNKASWSTFLNSITTQAKAQGVAINYINNKYVDNNGSFGHVLEIAVGCKGEYRNILKFINQIEKNILVTDVYHTHLYLEDNKTLTADINISVWGINH